MINVRIYKDIPHSLTLASGISDRLKALWILEKNDNNKIVIILGFPKVVHKRSTSGILYEIPNPALRKQKNIKRKNIMNQGKVL